MARERAAIGAVVTRFPACNGRAGLCASPLHPPVDSQALVNSFLPRHRGWRAMKILEIFAWPIAAVLIVLVVTLIFRGPLASLINRARRATIRGTSVDFGSDPSTTVAKQQESKTVSVADPTSLAPPPPSEVYEPIEKELQKTITTINAAPDVERAWLVRTIAMLRVMHAHEIVYRLIVGSQIALILEANTLASPDTNRARAIFDAIKTAFPDVYANFPFETWLNYPVNQGLLRIEAASTGPATVKITPLGRDFLHYLVNTGLTSGKSG